MSIYIATQNHPTFEKFLELVASAITQSDKENEGLIQQADNFFIEASQKFKSINETEIINYIIEKEQYFLFDATRQTGSFQVICYLISKMKDKSKQDYAIKMVYQFILKYDGMNSHKKLQILTDLFNCLNNDDNRQFGILKVILNFASQQSLYAALTKSFDKIDMSIRNWKLSQEDERELYFVLQSEFQSAKQYKQAATFSVRYLKTFDPPLIVNQQVFTQKSDNIADCFVTLLNYSGIDIHFEDLLRDSKAKAWLENHHKLLFGLVDQLLLAKYEALLVNIQSNEHEISAKRVNIQNLQRKARIQYLATLQQNKQYPFQELASKLKLSESGVESFIMDAVSAGAVEAQIDEIDRTVLLQDNSACFTDNWAQLETGLDTIIKKIQRVVAVTQ